MEALQSAVAVVHEAELIAGSQRVLSTSRDDTLRVWDAKQDMQQLASMKHYNNTGRWVVPFRAVWGPASDTVICGSMKRTVCHCSSWLALCMTETDTLCRACREHCALMHAAKALDHGDLCMAGQRCSKHSTYSSIVCASCRLHQQLY